MGRESGHSSWSSGSFRPAEKTERVKEGGKSTPVRPSDAGVQPRWIQGIRSGDGVGEDQETIT